MRRTLAILACLAGAAMGATPLPNVVNGKKVARLTPASMDELVSLHDVKLYKCVLPDENNRPAVIISGIVRSTLPTADYAVTIEFSLWRYPSGFRAYIYDGGKATVELNRLAPGKDTRFVTLVDEWITADVGRPGEKWLPAYTVRVSVDLYRPNRKD